jgi:ribonuclease P protein component
MDAGFFEIVEKKDVHDWLSYEGDVKHRDCFPGSLRIKDRREFAWLSQKGKSFSTEYFVVHWMITSRPHARLGLTVSTKFGSSVARNLFRRRAREAFRQSKLKKKTIDVNIRARGRKIPLFQDFCEIFSQLLTAVSPD